MSNQCQAHMMPWPCPEREYSSGCSPSEPVAENAPINSNHVRQLHEHEVELLCDLIDQTSLLAVVEAIAGICHTRAAQLDDYDDDAYWAHSAAALDAAIIDNIA